MSRGYVSYLAQGPQRADSGCANPGLALLGGPPDGPPPEVDEAFVWLIRKSNFGRFLVLGAGGQDEYNRYIYGHLPSPHPSSVQTLIFGTRDATSDAAVVGAIRDADALFIQGGDQWDYIRLWKGTPVQDAINHLARRGVPIGGSSAGLAVLGEFLFSARNDTIDSTQALADPYHDSVALERVLLDSPNIDRMPYSCLRNVITDSHFHDRDRMGRLLTFLARLAQDGWSKAPRAIAVDEMTAVLVEADGLARVVDNRSPSDRGAACFLSAPGLPEVCQPGRPLTYEKIAVHRIRASESGASFNLSTWSGEGGERYTVSAKQGTVGAE